MQTFFFCGVDPTFCTIGVISNRMQLDWNPLKKGTFFITLCILHQNPDYSSLYEHNLKKLSKPIATRMIVSVGGVVRDVLAF